MAADVSEILSRGEMDVLGQMPYSSNVTLLVDVRLDDEGCLGIYKPRRGEAPLHDFPGGLHKREVAAYELSQALGWEIVPTTVLVDDAPLGPGSLQHFIEVDNGEHFFTLIGDMRHDAQLRRIATFDVVANNADRKSGHCILGADDRIWAIDNGLCFHTEPKLRTVIWAYACTPIPRDLIDDLARLAADGLPAVFDDLLSREEREATIARTRQIVQEGTFPHDLSRSSYPWPLV